MTPLKLRMITAQSFDPKDNVAIVKTISEFSRYTVACETALLGKPGLRGVRYSSQLNRLLSEPEINFVNEMGEIGVLDMVREFISPSKILGVGITGQRVYTKEGNMKRELVGAGHFATYAMISTALLDSMPPELRQMAFELVIKHEIGHLLRDTEGHCSNSTCLMQANDKSIDRIAEMAKAGLDFCSSCQGAINRGIALIEQGALAIGKRIIE